MRKLSTFSVVVFASVGLSPCWAEGFTDISGKLGDGWEVLVDTEQPLSVWVWRRDRKGGISHDTEYKGEGCVLTYNQPDDWTKEVRTLACPAKGSTPLAGTKYVGRPFVKGDCEKGDPQFWYECVTGCGPNSPAPKVMRQEYWEC